MDILQIFSSVDSTLGYSISLVVLSSFLIIGLYGKWVPLYRVLVGWGFPLYTNNLKKDVRIYKKQNSDIKGWIHLPNVVYAPIMYSDQHTYQKVDYRGNHNLAGELQLLQPFQPIALSTDDSLGDLSLVSGSMLHRSPSPVHRGFTMLLEYVQKENFQQIPELEIYYGGKKYRYTYVFHFQTSLENAQTLRISDRTFLLQQLQQLTHKETDVESLKDVPLLFLKGNMDFDTLFVVCKRVGEANG